MMNEERGTLTPAQLARLLRPVRADRVDRKQGNLSYVPQHEVRAELIRIFGPGNVDHTMHDVTLVYETRLAAGDPQYPTKGDKPFYYVACYRAACTLRVRDYQGRPVAEFTEYHVEENAPQPNRGEAHAMAATSAQSYALRRAAISLGDALGLHLYNNGSLAPLIGGSLILAGDPESPYADYQREPNETLPEPAERVVDEVTGEVTDEPVRAPEKPAQRRGRPDIDGAFKKPTKTEATA